MRGPNHSGGSYLTRVEMQNGCFALAHSNLFIPSTLTGSNNSSTGIDTEQLLTNLDNAINVYIDRVNGAPCGQSLITLFKGAKGEHADKLQDRQKDLLIFLKGTKKLKTELKAKKPDKYDYFTVIWNLRKQHMVKGVPEKYVFFLLPCYKSDCVHPVCQRGKPQEEIKWFEGGPPLVDIPFPIPDPARPWGGNCTNCTSGCHGHYMSPAQCLEHIQKNGQKRTACFSLLQKPSRGHLIHRRNRKHRSQWHRSKIWLNKRFYLNVMFCSGHSIILKELRKGELKERKKQVQYSNYQKVQMVQ